MFAYRCRLRIIAVARVSQKRSCLGCNKIAMYAIANGIKRMEVATEIKILIQRQAFVARMSLNCRDLCGSCLLGRYIEVGRREVRARPSTI